MRWKKLAFAVLIALMAAILITLGLFRIVRVYKNYRADMLNYESRNLNSIVSSGARGIGWMMDGYAALCDQYPERREFIRAENAYFTDGDADAFTGLMKWQDLFWPDTPGCLGVYDEYGGLLAVSSDSFPVNNGTDTLYGEDFCLRIDTEGEYWFVFDSTSDTGIRFELAVSVQTVFDAQSEASSVGQHGYLFLMDKYGQFVSYSGDGVSETCSLEELVAEYPAFEPESIYELINQESESADDYHVYHLPWKAFQDKGTTETLVVTAPVVRAGGELILGAMESFQEFDSFLTDALRAVFWAVLMELGGAILLFFLAAWVIVDNRRDWLELKAVRERMELMEEISRQQQSLAHTERLQQLGVMTSGIVHEFNNMLTPIMSQSLLLLEELSDQEDSKQFESALDIYEASENAREMLRRISTMGKKDVDMGFNPLEIGGLLRKTMNMAALAKDPHIIQNLEISEEPIYVLGNDQLLTQAFLNLCINACQAMGSEGTLTIDARREARSGQSYVVVRVSDTGPGISEDRISHIYEPFYTTKGERGTGLGLAICQKIIETHKGTIRAENRDVGGAMFTVRIPTCEAPED